MNVYKKWKKWKIYIVGGIVSLISIISAVLIAVLIAIVMTIINVNNQQDGACNDNSNTDIGNIATSKDKTKNAKSIYDGLIKMGGTKEASAGILGALDFEASFNPSVTNSYGYHGIAQWGAERLTKLKAYASKHGGINSLQAQVGFIQVELNGNPQWKKILKYKDIHKATEDWTKYYEGLLNNPDQWHFKTEAGGHIGRMDSADQWYAKFANGSSSGGQGSDNIDNDTSEATESDCGSDNDIEGGDFVWPFETKVPPSGGQNYGVRTNPNGTGTAWHDGWDFGMTGQKIHFIHGGKIIFAGDPAKYNLDNSFPNGLGKKVVVTKASDGLEIVYQEFDMSGSGLKVKTGDTVKAGQVFATLKTDHLHLGITKKDWVKAQKDAFTMNSPTWLDPTKYLGGKNVKLPK